MRQKRNVKISVRLSEKELEKVMAQADERGVDLSKFIRYKLLAESEKSVYNSTYVSSMQQLVYEINRIGNNVNQIAYRLNTLQYDQNYISELKSNFEKCERLMLGLLEENEDGDHKVNAH